MQTKPIATDVLRYATDLDVPSYGAMPQDGASKPGIDQYHRIEDVHPWVIGTYVGSDPLGEFQAAHSFLLMCRKSDSVNKWRTTYGLKHHAESATGVYIGEGSFIRAGLRAGFSFTEVRHPKTYRMNIVTDSEYLGMLKALENARKNRLRNRNG